ncbi:MAG: VWA domain-containing protein [Pseudomonadota bacterium]|nr:VWA domain-containing protein [Pseudomonadota bacterium]
MNELADFLNAFLSGQLQWRAPLWLWGIFAPVIMMLWMSLLLRKNKQGYADAHLWPWVQVSSEPSFSKLTRPVQSEKGIFTVISVVILKAFNRLKRLISPLRLLALAWVCLMVAVAGPRSLQLSEMESSRAGVDVLVVMDLSHSMTADDVYPNRFLHAKSLVESLKNALQPDDRMALMGFAGQPHLVSPLSFDRGLFQHSLDLLEPNMMPTQGSWLELALIAGVNHLSKTAGQAKVMVVLTNGNPVFWQAPPLPSVVKELPFAKDMRASQTGVKIIMVGIGQPTPSTLPDDTHSSGKLHTSGVLVQSRLEEMSLKKWAHNLQGSYLRGSENREFMQRLLAEVTLPAGERSQSSNQQNWQEFAQPFMVLAALALLLAFYPLSIGSLQTKADERSHTLSSNSLLGLVALILAVSLFSQSVFAQTTSGSKVAIQQQAYDAYQAQDYELATALYDQINNYDGWMGAGSAAYKAEDLESAVLYFRQAALMANQDSARAKALFNLGNSYYLTNLLPQAIESYQQALLYQSTYSQAQHNLALASERLKIEQANQAKKQGKGEEGEEGDTGKGRGDDGAFYGGEKPNASSETPGFGADGDSIGGDRSGEAVILPMEGDPTDYELQATELAKLNADQRAAAATANAIIEKQKQLQRAQAFQQQLQQIDDQQKVLLQRLFEREEGFQAAQPQPHPIPGVQPW